MRRGVLGGGGEDLCGTAIRVIRLVSRYYFFLFCYKINGNFPSLIAEDPIGFAQPEKKRQKKDTYGTKSDQGSKQRY